MSNVEYTPENPKSIRLLFTRIARNYDLTNHVISLGLDIVWRKKFARLFNDRTKIADVCCGSGAMFPLFGNRTLAGVDFTRAMLQVCARRIPGARLVEGDAQKIPFASNTFDAAVIVYSVRNIPDLKAAMSELFRVLEPQGMLGILDFGTPENRILQSLYLFYFKTIMPLIGDLVARDKGSYHYFVNSVLRFPKRKAFLELLESAGFQNCSYKQYFGGAALCYTALKA